MGKNNVHEGGTDATQPGYFDVGRSELSPEVVGNPDHPTEADYTAAMERHGTDDFTAEDQATVDAWKRDRDAEAEQEKRAAATKPGETANGTGSKAGEDAVETKTTTTTRTTKGK